MPKAVTMKGVLILTILIGLGLTNGEWIDDLSGLLNITGISEGTGVGTILGTLKYNSNTSVVFSTTSEYLDVLPNGTVSLKKQLVYKTLKTFKVTFAATAQNQAPDPRTFDARVLPINHAPTFDAPSYRASINNPNLAIGTFIYNSIIVTDPDEGNNGTVTVVCDRTLSDDAETCDFFSVNILREQDGTYRVTVTLAKSLSPNRRSYSLSLKAMDGGNLSSSATLQFIVESLVDSRPVFIDSQIIFSVDEFEPLGSIVSNINVRDGRQSAAGNTLSFDIQDDSLNWFGVAEPQISADGLYNVPILITGNISLKNNKMDTRYTFNFYARQLLNGQVNSVNSHVTVLVNIRDVNDNVPTFGQSSYTATVTEGLVNGATISGLSIIVYDNDLGNNSYFELSVESSPSPVPGIFGLVPTSGQGNAAVAVIVNRPEYVRVNSQLPKSYTLTLTARETRTEEKRSSTATVAIQVISLANHPPYFPFILNPIVVLDNVPVGTVISTYIKAQDDDQGTNGVITYSLGNDPVANDYFSINSQTGILSLKRALNYTVKSSFAFNVIATDGGGLTATLPILINLVDFRRLGPQFSLPSYVANVTELQTNMFPPITIQATLEPMRSDRVIKYELSPALSPEILSMFKIDNMTGSLTMLKGVDYKDTPNKQGYLDLQVQASVVNYPEIPISTVPCRIHVLDTNNHAPTFLPINETYRKTIKDNTPPSTTMFNLHATDDDVGQNAEITYYIQMGAQDNFNIDPFNGVLSVANYPKLVPDTTYNITVIAVDRGQPPLTGTTMVYITVVDSVSRPPVFQLNEYTFYVMEGSPQGLLIGTAKATSLDRRATISYSFMDTTWKAFNYSDVEITSAQVQNWFSVSSSTAEIIVQGNIVYTQARKATVQLSARVTNPDSDVTRQLSTNVPVTIYILSKGENTNVVRFSPETNSFYIKIYEQQPINTEVFRFNAFYYGTSTPVTDFTFVNQSVDGENLILERTTGILKIKDVIYYARINPTKNLTYFVMARAPTAQAVARMVVNVLPLSNNPIFTQTTYHFSVNSNDLPGKVIGMVHAEKPPNVTGQIIYNIDNLDTSRDIFQINENGTIILLRRLDELNSTRTQYSLLISATLPDKTFSRAVVYIQVVPVPLVPRFNELNYKFNVLSNFNGPIGRVSAYDPSPFTNFPITYNLVGITPASNTFSIDQITGMINMTSQTANGSYVLNVSATVGSSPPLTSYTPVNVLVLSNSQDQPPQFLDFPQDVFGVYYNYPNALILKVNQTIVAPGRESSLYLDTSALPDGAKYYFYFNNITRELRVNGTLDGSSSVNYTLILVLNDGRSSELKKVTVGVYSNAPPTFNCKTKPIQVNVLDLSPPGTTFMPSVGIPTNSPCSYNKPDTIFFYKILSSNLTSPSKADLFDDVFGIDNKTGEIFSKTTMNAYLLDWSLLKVLVAQGASDVESAKGRAGATSDVIVRFTGRAIRDPNFSDVDPYCPGSGLFMQKTVMDLSPINSQVVKVHAGSCDMPGFRDVTYDIQGTTFNYYANSPEAQSGTAIPTESQRAFGVDPNSGQVYTQVEDFRPFYSGWFSTNVRASSRNNANLTSTANLKLYVMREYQMLKATFSREVATVRNNSDRFLNIVNGMLKPNYQIIPSLVTTYVDPIGARNTSASSLCYALLKLDNSSGTYFVTKDIYDVTRFVNLTVLRKEYGVESLFDDCFPISTYTTKWWSDKWFLWFILIAFSILVFVVALVLTCCVCFYWPMNLKEISKARPYVVLGDPAMSTAGSVLGERW